MWLTGWRSASIGAAVAVNTAAEMVEAGQDDAREVQGCLSFGEKLSQQWFVQLAVETGEQFVEH